MIEWAAECMTASVNHAERSSEFASKYWYRRAVNKPPCSVPLDDLQVGPKEISGECPANESAHVAPSRHNHMLSRDSIFDVALPNLEPVQGTSSQLK